MRFPFDDNTMEDIMDKPLVLSWKKKHAGEFSAERELVLNFDGTRSDAGKWEILGGALRFLNADGELETEFGGAEVQNGVAYAVGKVAAQVVRSKNQKATLHVRKQLGSDFNICVSSHVNYAKTALSRLLSSLLKEGFSSEKIFVVIGGNDFDGEMEYCEELHANVMYRRDTVYGMNALGRMPANVEVSYWLLLHDTCEVEDGFLNKIGNIDVGLNPDTVLFRPVDEKMDMGIYSKKISLDAGNIPKWVKPHEYLSKTVMQANVVSVLSSSKHGIKTESPKDVYGYGVKRETLRIPSLGIRKYRAKALNVSKP
jgi:hypothetical protein